jgi:homogentisate 1,2-dioxygenase
MGLVGGSHDAKAATLCTKAVALRIQVGGSYDAKAGGEDGFAPGGASLHVASTPHGPDTESYGKALAADTSRPQKLEGGLAFMFETAALLTLTPHAATSSAVQPDYAAACWAGLPRARVDV